jgi:hypothetical protein
MARWVEHADRIGKMRNVCNIFLEKPEGRRQSGSARSTCVDNIKMNPRKTGFYSVDWVHLPQDRDWLGAPVKTVMNLCDP